MSSFPQRQPYQTFQELIQNFKAELMEENLDPGQVQAQFGAIQAHFQQAILPLARDEEDEALELPAQVRSIHVEIAKQLKLISLEVMFLQAAKQPKTAHQRQQQIVDRLKLLLSYSEFILNL